ncbi:MULTISPECIES: hypothetical protein [Chitinophagaceae]
MQNKKLILLIPTEFKFNELFEENAKKMGFEVVSLSNMDNLGKFRYANIFVRLQNMLRKIFLHDYEFKKKLRIKYQRQAILKMVVAFSGEKADYALYVRPDLWEFETVKTVSTLAKKNVCYQWDGFKRYPSIERYLSLFDHFFTFSTEDIVNHRHKFHFSTNFYFDCFDADKKICTDYDIFYIGTYIGERIELLIQLAQYFNAINKSYKFILNKETSIEIGLYKNLCNTGVVFAQIAYKEMIDYVKKCKVLIDIQNSIHNGLSFRIFEALFFQKKLITNNPNVKDYDFYNPANIFILTASNMNEVQNFLSLPYCPVAESIKIKYSFTNWIKYILNIEPHQKIEIPQIV